MPHFQPLNALDGLRDRLRSELDVRRADHSVEWGNPRAMSEVLKRVKRELGGESADSPSEEKLQVALQHFADRGKVATFTDLKYVCYGVTVPIGRKQWRLIDQRASFEGLLALVNQRAQLPKQFRRCYQGLLSGYFGFQRDLDSPGDAQTLWLSLREYLRDQLEPLREASAKRGQAPEWLSTLSEHRNLLTSDPCSRYAEALARDDEAELHKVCAGLGISSNSWVWEDAFMAYVKLVCAGEDAGFKQRLSSVVALVNGRTSITLPTALAIKATAQIVTRYEKCADHPEIATLRDTCVEWIGNPWLKRTVWDAVVGHEPARLMVNSWLKQRLIRDFFELLAADGAADLRRLNYWLRWEPQITDMWFVLGRDAQANRSPEFLELRKRMAGRDRLLQDNNQQNNAFVMRIGQLLVIEFGVTGNACYAFAAADFQTSLNKRILSIYELKQKAHAERLSHRGYWEAGFDYDIRKLLQSVPLSKSNLITESTSTRPHTVSAGRVSTAVEPSVQVRSSGASSSQLDGRVAQGASGRPDVPSPKVDPLEFSPLQQLLNKHGLAWEDNRPKGGAFWVLVPDGNLKPAVANVLQLYRFKFAEGKGYWLKD